MEPFERRLGRSWSRLGGVLGALLIDDFGFGEGQVVADLPAASYRVGFDAGATGIVDLTFNLPALAPGLYANVFVVNDAAGTVFLLVQTNNDNGTSAARIDPAN